MLHGLVPAKQWDGNMDKNDIGLDMKYYVLKPQGSDAYAKASRLAMLVYAEYIETHNPNLAKELIVWCRKEFDNTKLDQPNEK